MTISIKSTIMLFYSRVIFRELTIMMLFCQCTVIASIPDMYNLQSPVSQATYPGTCPSLHYRCVINKEPLRTSSVLTHCSSGVCQASAVRSLCQCFSVPNILYHLLFWFNNWMDVHLILCMNPRGVTVSQRPVLLQARGMERNSSP